MSRYAVVNGSGNVVNTVLWDGSAAWAPQPGYTAVASDTADVGWRYSGGVFTPPTPPAFTPPPPPIPHP